MSKVKLSRLYDFAASDYETYLQWNCKVHLDSALEYYKQYKKRVGKRVHKGLESRLARK